MSFIDVLDCFFMPSYGAGGGFVSFLFLDNFVKYSMKGRKKMKTSLREYLLEYSTPDTEIVYALYADLVCNSPGGGENEDVGYEEW